MFERLRNFFRKAGANVGVVERLSKITDHPKIGANPSEYERIATALRYYRGTFPKVKFKNTYGVTKERDYTTLNMAEVSAHRLASILFNEEMTFEIADKEANEYAQMFMKDNDFNKNFGRYLESGLALGGLAMRPYFDQVTGALKISWIQAPVFYPLRSNTADVHEAAIATVTRQTEGSKIIYYTLLEFHEWSGQDYTITNELYQSERADEVGIKVSLKTLYEDLQPVTTFADLSRPQFVYLKPAHFNNKDINSPLGLSIFDNAIPTLRSINDATDQFNWEIKMGQRRVAVPESMTQVMLQGDTQPRQIFDSNQNVYLMVESGMNNDADIKDLTSVIRSQAYIDTINQKMKTLEMQLGLSSGTFTFDGQGVKTATEVVSENSMTYQTRNSQLTNIERAIQELIVSAMEQAAAFGLYTGDIPSLEDITVNFDDGVFTDKAAQADYWSKLVAAGLASRKQAIMAVQGVDEKTAQKTLTEIDETGEETNADPDSTEQPITDE